MTVTPIHKPGKFEAPPMHHCNILSRGDWFWDLKLKVQPDNSRKFKFNTATSSIIYNVVSPYYLTFDLFRWLLDGGTSCAFGCGHLSWSSFTYFQSRCLSGYQVCTKTRPFYAFYFGKKQAFCSFQCIQLWHRLLWFRVRYYEFGCSGIYDPWRGLLEFECCQAHWSKRGIACFAVDLWWWLVFWGN